MGGSEWHCKREGSDDCECTCAAVFGATVRKGIGTAGPLLGYMELTRIALERCATARAVVQCMGDLAIEHGFAGNTDSLSGAAESLAVVDGKEAWVFHVLPDDTGTSAIWAAQRLKEGHVACVPNVFVIREMDLTDPSFLLSSNAKSVALRNGLWEQGAPFDFARIFSSGEARHRYYSGRRQCARALAARAIASAITFVRGPAQGFALPNFGRAGHADRRLRCHADHA